MSMDEINQLRQRRLGLMDQWMDEDSPEERELVRVSQELARKIVEYLQETKPDPKRFNELASEAHGRVLYNLISIENEDEAAERYYISAKLSELAATDMHWTRFLANAFGDYESALEKSNRGTGSRLAFYQAEFAAFRSRWPKVRRTPDGHIQID